MMFLIKVSGEIIAKDKNQYAQFWVCGSVGEEVDDYSYKYDPILHSVKGNLIFNKNRRAVPYASYYTDKGIRVENSGNIFCAPGAMAAELCYKDNISEIERLFNIKVVSEIEIYFYKGLLTSIFSILELFLSDLILCLIFSNKTVYERASGWIIKHANIKNLPIRDTDIQRYFTEKIVYHRFDKIENIFKHILRIQLPKTQCLRSYLYKRNNINHRFAFSNIDRMRMTTIDSDTLNKFILCCNEFVEKIMNEINSVYYQKD